MDERGLPEDTFAPLERRGRLRKMVKKPQTAVVQDIIKNLLEYEIPEIQTMAKKLASQIKKLEEHSLKLQEYVAQIESLATEKASALVQSQISDILKDLDKALGELKQRSKKPTTASQVTAEPTKRIETEEIIEGVADEVETTEEKGALPRPPLRPPAYTTPEGFLIKKTRH